LTLSRRAFLGAAGLAGAAALASPLLPRVASASTALPLVGRKFGCYYPAAAGTYNLETVETQVGREFDDYSCFISLDSGVSGHPEFATASSLGKELLICFQPSRTVGINFAGILAGVYDAKLDEWFAFAQNRRVTFRWGHEMNGDWEPWSPYNFGKHASSNCSSPAQFVEVWQYVVTRQRTQFPSSTVKWGWCPNYEDHTPSGQTPYPMEQFWPGVDYVDRLMYDVYNSTDGSWRTPDLVARGYTTHQGYAYDRVLKLDTTTGKPVWIGEFGCYENPKDPNGKAAWYAALFGLPATFLPRLSVVNFFDAGQKFNWSFDTTPQSLAAFRAGFDQAGTPE
jgi:hypothetical protein